MLAEIPPLNGIIVAPFHCIFQFFQPSFDIACIACNLTYKLGHIYIIICSVHVFCQLIVLCDDDQKNHCKHDLNRGLVGSVGVQLIKHTCKQISQTINEINVSDELVMSVS